MSRFAPLLCLFLSGFAGLVYEVCWIRQGTLVFGSSTVATSTVLAVFFAGLALGSALFGRWSARLSRPFRAYAAVEIGVAALGVASLALFPLADTLYGGAYRAVAEGSIALGALRVVLVSAILLPAATLMGATLPLICAAFSGRAGAAPVGTWYGINTLGAAAGALAAGLLLIPGIGVARTILMAAGANVIAAMLASRIREPSAEPVEPAAQRAVRPQDAARRALPLGFSAAWMRHTFSALFFLSGFVALAHEVLWTRYLGLLCAEHGLHLHAQPHRRAGGDRHRQPARRA